MYCGQTTKKNRGEYGSAGRCPFGCVCFRDLRQPAVSPPAVAPNVITFEDDGSSSAAAKLTDFVAQRKAANPRLEKSCPHACQADADDVTLLDFEMRLNTKLRSYGFEPRWYSLSNDEDSLSLFPHVLELQGDLISTETKTCISLSRDAVRNVDKLVGQILGVFTGASSELIRLQLRLHHHVAFSSTTRKELKFEPDQQIWCLYFALAN